jgi:RNA polymerase sigma-70 factor (ECF subfamily)
MAASDDPRRSDAALLRDCRRRPEAFRLFYERHAERVFAQLLRRVERRDVALELTAETFAQALRSAATYREDRGNASAWLTGIAKHLVSDYLRTEHIEDVARRASGIRDATTFAGVEDDTVARLDAQATRGQLSKAIAALPRRQRSAVQMRVVEEASYSVIAERLGCSETAARIRVHRGLERLRSQLGVTA